MSTNVILLIPETFGKSSSRETKPSQLAHLSMALAMLIPKAVTQEMKMNLGRVTKSKLTKKCPRKNKMWKNKFNQKGFTPERRQLDSTKKALTLITFQIAASEPLISPVTKYGSFYDILRPLSPIYSFLSTIISL